MLRDFMLTSSSVDVGSPASVTPPRAAATVMLLRDSHNDCGIEVFMIKRARTMIFAAGMAAFPGGAQEDHDSDVVDTAIRETAEECGVRVDRGGLQLWARWLTPEFEPRRYDTYFFMMETPEGATARATNGEAERAFWIAAGSAVAAHHQGRLPMLPPTLVMLEDLAAAGSVAAALATPREVVRVSPWRVELPDGRWVLRVDLDGRGGGRPRSVVEPAAVDPA
jgi:8-oxo-dGTP pyrophosphatase MutT (NUDIX family)